MLRNILSIALVLLPFTFISGQVSHSGCPEKIILTTDREEYIAGEWLYFNLFIDASPTVSDNCYQKSKVVYLILRNVNNTHISENLIELNAQSFNGSLYIQDTLTTGQYQLIAFTNYMRNYGENEYFIKNILVVNRFDNDLSYVDNHAVSSNKDSIGIEQTKNEEHIKIAVRSDTIKKREKINFEIQLAQEKMDAMVSVVVRRKSVIKIIEPVDTMHSIALRKDNNIRFVPESRGIVLQGSLLDDNNKGLPNKLVYLSTIDSIINLQYSTTDQHGVFHFGLPPYYDGKKLFIKTGDTDKATFVMDDKFALSTPFKQGSISVTGDPKLYLNYIRNVVNIQKINNLLNQPFSIQGNDHSSVIVPAVYTKPHSTVVPSEYIYLPDFVEISRELLVFLRTRVEHNEYTAELWDIINNSFTNNAFFFLDGVLIDNIQQIIHFDSKAIRKIEFLPYPRYLGNLNMPGIMSVFSTHQAIDNLKWSKPRVVVQHVNRIAESTFSTVPAGTIKKHTPDFKNLLLWQPSVKITDTSAQKFEVYASDGVGEFEIVVTGIDKEGKRIAGRKTITITPNR